MNIGSKTVIAAYKSFRIDFGFRPYSKNSNYRVDSCYKTLKMWHGDRGKSVATRSMYEGVLEIVGEWQNVERLERIKEQKRVAARDPGPEGALRCGAEGAGKRALGHHLPLHPQGDKEELRLQNHPKGQALVPRGV